MKQGAMATPTNPTVKITDIARVARPAHLVGAVVVIDNTFATPGSGARF